HDGLENLAHVAAAHGRPGGLAGIDQRRQQDGDQQRDNRHHDKNLDQGKTPMELINIFELRSLPVGKWFRNHGGASQGEMDTADGGSGELEIDMSPRLDLLNNSNLSKPPRQAVSYCAAFSPGPRTSARSAANSASS